MFSEKSCSNLAFIVVEIHCLERTYLTTRYRIWRRIRINHAKSQFRRLLNFGKIFRRPLP